MSRGRVKVLLILAALIAVGLAGALCFPAMRGMTPQEVFSGTARTALNPIWLVGVTYAENHDGKFPPDLDTLLKDSLYNSTTPSAIAQLKERVTYFGASRAYDPKDDKTVFAKYRWPLIGEATIYDSKKVEVIVYGKKEMIVYDGNEVLPQDMRGRHEVLIEK